MTIAQMRAILGMGSEFTDAQVIEAYAAYLGSLAPSGSAPELTLSFLKQYLRYDGNDQDTVLTVALNAAIGWVEKRTGCILRQRVVTQAVRHFGRQIELYHYPVTGPVSIAYTDSGGIAQTLTDTRLADTQRPATVHPLHGASWPIMDCSFPAIVTYTAGYAEPEDVPEDLLFAVLLLAGNFDRNRSAVVTGTISNELPFGVESLTDQYRVVSV